jgi:hypothetical protein
VARRLKDFQWMSLLPLFYAWPNDKMPCGARIYFPQQLFPSGGSVGAQKMVAGIDVGVSK